MLCGDARDNFFWIARFLNKDDAGAGVFGIFFGGVEVAPAVFLEIDFDFGERFVAGAGHLGDDMAVDDIDGDDGGAAELAEADGGVQGALGVRRSIQVEHDGGKSFHAAGVLCAVRGIMNVV